MILYNTQIEEL